jgi:hypothetical protein
VTGCKNSLAVPGCVSELEKSNILIIGPVLTSNHWLRLLYGAKNEKFNNAIALKEYLEDKMKK